MSITMIWDYAYEAKAKAAALESGARGLERIVQGLENRVRALESQRNNYSPPTTSTPISTYRPPTVKPTPSIPVSTTISVGDRVRIKSGVTQYWDQDDRRVTIPTNLHGRNYRTLTYTIGYIATNGKIAKYRLDYEGWAIAWAKPEILTKV